MSDFETKQDSFFTRNPRLVTSAFVGFLLLAFIYNSCVVYIRPNEYGVKKVNIGLKKGLSKKIYETGLQFVIPFGFQEMYRFPKDVQVLEMTNNPRYVSKDKSYQKAVRIQTSDGFYVYLDVSIFYRIKNAYQVITTLGPGKLFIQNGIIPRAEPALKKALGELTTEEFYNSPLRVEKTEKAKELLQKELAPKGLEIEHILVRYFKYSDEIQNNIEEKKLKDQLVFKNQSEARAATERAKLNKIIAEGNARVDVELEKGKGYAVRKNAEKDLYSRKKHAEANLLISLAEAKRTELKNDAFNSVGSDKRVGLEMAKVLSGIEFIMLPSTGASALNPLDLDSMTDLFGVKHEK